MRRREFIVGSATMFTGALSAPASAAASWRIGLELLDMSGFSCEATKEAIYRFRQRCIDGRTDLREAQSVRMRAFDEFCERAAERAVKDGFLDRPGLTVSAKYFVRISAAFVKKRQSTNSAASANSV